MKPIDILVMIDNHIKANGYPPTRMELSGEMGTTSPNGSQYHLDQLVKQGLITMEPRKSRSIVITGAGKTAIRQRNQQ